MILSIVVGLSMCILGAVIQHPLTKHSTMTSPTTQEAKLVTIGVTPSTRCRVRNPVRIEKQDMYAASLHSLPNAHCLYQNNTLEHGPRNDRLQLTDSLPGVRVSAAEQPESVAYAPPEVITNNIDDIVGDIKSGVGQAAFEHQNEFPASVPYVYPGTVLYRCKPAKPQPKPVQYRKANNEQTYVPLPVAQRCGTGQPVPENYNESPASVSYSSPTLTAYDVDPSTASGGNTILKHTTWTGNPAPRSQQNYHVNPALASSGTGYGAPAYEGVNEFPADVDFKTQRTQTYQVQPSLASQGSPGLATPANERRNEFPARVNFKTNRITAYHTEPQRSSQHHANVSPANERQNEFPAALDR